jgi:lysophospholipase L1-like esterase
MEVVLRLFFPLSLGGELIRVIRQEHPGVKPVVVYRRNAFGLRSRSVETLEKPPDTIRVMAFGASTTDQTTQNMEDSWVGIVEDELRTAFAGSGTRIEVAGFGRGGLGVSYLLHILPGMVRAFQPDLVITLMGVNDLAWRGGPDYTYTGFRPPAEPPPDPPRTSDSRTCSDVSQLCRRLALLAARVDRYQQIRRGKAVRWHTQRLEKHRATWRELPFRAAPRRDPDPIREFGDGMALVLDELVEAGVDALVLGQPVLWKADMTPAELDVLWFHVRTPEGPVRADGAWLAAEIARYNEVQRRLAAERGFAYLDLDASVPKDLDHYFDDCHYTDRGSRLVAEEVLTALRPRIERLLASR